MNAQKRTWEIIEVAGPGDSVSRAVDVFVLLLIGANIIAVIAASVARRRSLCST